MTTEKDGTPLTENIGDIAANEGVPSAEPPKRKRGRPPGSGKKAAPGNGAPKEDAPKAKNSAPHVEPPFSAAELRDAMTTMGTALFALPGEFLASRRPDIADKLNLTPDEAVFGGKAVTWYFSARFPDLIEKWGPEAMLTGCALLFYAPRIILMVQTPKPVAPEASIDGKPAPIRAVPSSP